MTYKISLRPHHFLCILTYIGKGYTKNFTDNYDEVIRKLDKGDCEVQIISGPDDICSPRLCDTKDTNCHCNEKSIIDRDNEALIDFQSIHELSSLKMNSVIPFTKTLINALRIHYKTGIIRTACKGCEWIDLCNNIVKDDFKGTKLK